MITDNVATLLTNLFIGYYGKTAHKPRWMSFGCAVTGLSVMVTALPYFIYGPAQEVDLETVGNMTLSTMRSKNAEQTCLSQPIKEECHGSGTAVMTMVAVACFGISNFFRGFGTSIYFTYGTPYLDDNVSKAKMPTFFAFIFAARLCGAPIGFFFSSLALKYYENPFSKPDGLEPTDPRWIGAWWIGFLVSGFLLLLLAIPLSMFPREFRKSKSKASKADPNQVDIEAADPLNKTGSKLSLEAPVESMQLVARDPSAPVKQNGFSSSAKEVAEAQLANQTANKGKQVTTSVSDDSGGAKKQDLTMKELPGEIYAIITNPIILCQMMGNMFRGIGIIGYFVFQTKYLEAQFRQSASKASLVTGTTGFAAKISGVLLGGLLITLLRPGPRMLTTYIFLVELTSVFTLMYGASVLGPQYAYPMTQELSSGQLELGNTCNSKCFCDHVRYQPVCDTAAMKAYFSPCHAGCETTFKTADDGVVYTHCKCLQPGDANTLEKCPPDTENLLRYATIVAVGSMISGSSRSGNMVTYFRAVNPDQKALTVAVGSFWHSLTVAIPYPIIYGKLFDAACLVWSHECNKRGNCWLYNVDKLRISYHAVSIGLIAIGSMFDLLMIFLSPRLSNLYDDDENGATKRSLRDRLMFWKKYKQVHAAKAKAAAATTASRSNEPPAGGVGGGDGPQAHKIGPLDREPSQRLPEEPSTGVQRLQITKL